MVNIKKINMFVCSLLMVLTSLFFVACGNKNYDNVSLTCSESSISIDVGQEKEFVFSINNMIDGMDNSLNISFSPQGIVSHEVISKNENQTTIKIVGVEAGSTTLKSTTIDGGKVCNVTINVKKYSDYVNAGQNSLYVSSNSPLTISTNDFVFEDTASEKKLDFYFYGVNNGYTLSLDNVSSNVNDTREFYNKFISVKLINQDGGNYLVFTDDKGQEYVLGRGQFDLSYSGNTKYYFVSVEKVNDVYQIPAGTPFVNIGDAFTFIANYQNPEGKEIFAQREFIVLKDIDLNTISSSYGYIKYDQNDQEMDETYFIENFDENKITLVPNYLSNIDNETIDFKQAKLVIQIPQNSEELLYSFSFDNDNIFNVTAQKNYMNGISYYIFTISTKTQIENKTNFNVKFYYDGFENFLDENVCVNISCPIEIKNKPNSIVISGSDFSNTYVENKTFTFYNHYQSDNVGWQRFYFDVFPLGSNYDYLTIDLQENSGLIVRYKGTIYTEGEVVIDDFNSYVEFRGQEGTEEKNAGTLTLKLNFNLLMEDSLISTFNYKISKGSTIISYDENFNLNTIGLSINSDSQGVDLSNILYTDASFSELEINLISGDNVAKFSVSENPYIEKNGRFYLNFGATALSVGQGTYSVILPNGLAASITIEVVETLEGLSIKTTNQNANMSIISFDENQALVYARYNTEKNDAKNLFDIELIANSNELSNAILNYEYFIESKNLITLTDIKGNNFNVNLSGIGQSSISLTVRGYSVENYEIVTIERAFTINVVSYEYIKELSINKLSDGQGSYEDTKARYVYLYNNNANSSSKKQASLDIDISFFNDQVSAFLFKNPSSGNFDAETFSLKFVSWTAPGYKMLLNGDPVDCMFWQEGEQSLYEIINSSTGAIIATFDAQSLVLELGSGAGNSFSFTLIASIDQFDISRKSYTINVNVLEYDAVERLNTLTPITSLEFSSFESSHEIDLRVLQNDAINKNIRVSIQGDAVSYQDITYKLFGENNAGIIINGQGASVVTLSLVADDNFIKLASENSNFFGGKTFNATLTIAAEDWYKDTGELLEENKTKVISIPITFANGSIDNPFTIDSSSDLQKVSNNLKANYKVTTVVDASALSLPLGALEGSIVGANDYAKITNININSLNGNNFAGLFTEIAEGASVKNLSFEGVFNINVNSLTSDAYIGLIAGKNKGSIENVSVNINKSSIIINNQSVVDSQNLPNVFIGGLVGKNEGEIVQNFSSDDNLISYSLFMNDFLDINYYQANVYAGGIAGISSGLIKKIDGNSFAGYTNYLAYSLINVEPKDLDGSSIGYVGAVAGKILIQENNSGLYSVGADGSLYSENTYTAGKGIVVGGEIYGLNYVGGVVGELEIDGSVNDFEFSGITARTFVRAYSDSTNLGLISGKVNNNSSGTISPTFFIQAIDDGDMGEKSSMFVIYHNLIDAVKIDVNDETYSLTKLAFGKESNESTFENRENNFISYITREYVSIDESSGKIQIIQNQTQYYGEIVVVNQIEDTIIQQRQFVTRGSSADLSVTENASLKNKMSSNDSSNLAFFAFYFDAVSAQISESQAGLDKAQDLLNANYNTLSLGDDLYPININGEITLESLNTNILKIDQNGKMTILGTGWVQISGSSILNVNNGVNFYIYVTNYFNNDNNISIIYPNNLPSASPIDVTELSLFANQTVTLYVIPNYNFSQTQAEGSESTDEEKILNVDDGGVGSIGGYYFNIAKNENVTANVEILNMDDEENKDDFSVSVTGQTITITKQQTEIANGEFKIIITPMLVSSLNSHKFFCEVNKKLENGKIKYEKGALAMGASRYDNVTFSTSSQINETIYVKTTSDAEDLQYYLKFNDKIVQSDYLTVYNNSENGLFNITFGNPTSRSEGGLIKEYSFPLKVFVNTESDAFKNRFENNIYGDYQLVILSTTNSNQYITINLTFENLPIQNIIIDNYNNQAGMTSEIGVATNYSYPGEDSLLAVTLNPGDSDFDYLVIENADINNNFGNGFATFTLAARKDGREPNTNLFEANKIVGSATTKGLILTKEEILELYNQEGYKSFDGIVYFIYNIGNYNVSQDAQSTFVVKVYKDGKEVSQTITLSLKLKNFVSLAIDGKSPEIGNENQYRVAVGLKYKLNISSYGINSENISAPYISEGAEYGTIVLENGNYYVQIAETALTNSATMKIKIEEINPDYKIPASSEITLVLMNYVIDSSINDVNGEPGNKDIISSMVNGVITMPIGTSRSISLDIGEYLEYDNTNQAIINIVNAFINELTQNANWNYYLNIEPGQSVPGIDAGEAKYKYDLPVNVSLENYYFRYQDLTIVPLRINEANANLYYFKYRVYYSVSGAGYSASSQSSGDSAASITTEIRFEVFVSSSEESPIPIFDYDDFMDMKEGGYYILLNDIILPSAEYVENIDSSYSQYLPLNANFASLDGNGHAIILDGTYDMGNASQLGIFTTLKSGSVIKNLNIKLLSSFITEDANSGVIFKTTNAQHRTGLLVGTNEGTITNCYVYSPTNTFFTMNCALQDIESAYVGGICGENNGFITNCSSSINIYGSFNIAGIAGVNNNKISACSYKGGVLKSSSDQLDEGFHVAGLVNVNNSSGKIITSYVTGGIDESSLYSTNTSSYLSGPNFSAGFVYENNGGYISDCYSDINLQNSANMAGFVYVNTGSVKNSFSLSILQSGTIAAAGFAMRNTPFGEEQESDQGGNQSDNSGSGIFENCFYLSHAHISSGKNACNSCGFTSSINVDLNTIKFEGVSAIDDFNVNTNDAFKDFAYVDNISTDAVWFFSGNNYSNNGLYVNFTPSEETTTIDNDNGIGVQKNTIYNVENMALPKGRLELSAPNIQVLSIRNFQNADVDNSTGDITYNYIDDISTTATQKATRGSLYNPLLINSPQTMESLILENNDSSTNQNSMNYRIISDVDYGEYDYNSQLYKTVFVGSLEGNGMEISSIVLQSNSIMENAGLFAKLGISSSKSGIIKNLILSPSVVNFASTSSVGALVGNVYNGKLYNIQVTTTNTLTVQGSNFVGGVVGKAQGNYVFKNISANVNAVANYTPTTDQIYQENLNSLVFSYAGGLFGYLGSGFAENVSVENISTIRGDRAGFVAGGIGAGGNLTDVTVTVSENGEIKANSYGGIALGEVCGKVSYVNVIGNGNTSNIFSIVGQLPKAVGGITGALSGGSINNAVIDQSFAVGSKKIGTSSTYSTVNYVGGIVGVVNNNGASVSTISQVVVSGDISASSTLGGAIGGVLNTVQLDQIAIKSENFKVSGQMEYAILGGMIGYVPASPSPQITIKNSYCRADLTIDIQNALNRPNAQVGGLIASSTTNVILNNCYTTSRISLTLKYLNSIESNENFYGLEDNEDDAASFYKQVPNNDSYIENVYYYGCQGGSSVNILKNFISCYSNFDLSSNVTINNYGKDSYNFSNGSNSQDSLKNVQFSLINIPEETKEETNKIKINIYDSGDSGRKSLKEIKFDVQDGMKFFTVEEKLGNEWDQYKNYKIVISFINENDEEINQKVFEENSFVYWFGSDLGNEDFRYLLFEDNLFWM